MTHPTRLAGLAALLAASSSDAQPSPVDVATALRTRRWADAVALLDAAPPTLDTLSLLGRVHAAAGDDAAAGAAWARAAALATARGVAMELVPAVADAVQHAVWRGDVLALSRVLEARGVTGYDGRDHSWWAETRDASSGRVWARWQLALPVGALTMDRAGMRVAVSAGETVEVRDPWSGARLASWRTPAGVIALEFSPDGRSLAGACEDGHVRTWDGAGRELRALRVTGQTPVVMRVYNGPGTRHVNIPRLAACAPTTLAWRDDGRALAAGASDGVIWVWDTASGRATQLQPARSAASRHVPGGAVENREAAPLALRFEGAGPAARLVAVDGQGAIVEWKPATRARRPRSAGACSAAEVSAAMGSLADSTPAAECARYCHAADAASFSPDGARVALAVRFDGVLVRDARTGAPVSSWSSLHRKAIAFSPAGERVALAGIQGGVQLWRPDTGAFLGPLPTGSVATTPPVVSADGRWVATVELVPVGPSFEVPPRRVLRVYDTRSPTPLAAPAGTVAGVAFAGASDRLALLRDDGALEIWSLGRREIAARAAPAPTPTPTPATGMYRSFVVAPDGRRAVSAANAAMRVFDLGSGTARDVSEPEGGRVERLRLSTDGSRWMSVHLGSSAAPSARRVDVWDAPTGRRLRAFADVGSDVADLSPDGRSAVVVPASGDALELRDVATGATLERHATTERPRGAWFAPDGRALYFTQGLAGPLNRWALGSSADVTLGVPGLGFEPVTVHGPVVVASNQGRGFDVVRARDGALLAAVRATSDGGWAALTPDGAVDGPLAGRDAVTTRLPQRTDGIALPWQLGWGRAHVAGLLERVMRGEAVGPTAP